VAHNLICGVHLIIWLTSEGIEHVTASMHGVSQYVQLKEHSLVCDVPSHGLIDDDVCSKQNLAEAIIHTLKLRLGELAEKEINGSSGKLTED
jgi:hypothetical protein